MKLKLRVKRYADREREYRDKWIAAELLAEEPGERPYINAYITPGGKKVELFSLDLLYDSKESAEEALALYLLLRAGR